MLVFPASDKTTTAATFWPQASDGKPTTAHSLTFGWLSSSRSISNAEIFSPPLLIMSALRRPWMKYVGPRAHEPDFPSPEPGTARRIAISPVLNHPSHVNSFSVAVGFHQYSEKKVGPQTFMSPCLSLPVAESTSSPCAMIVSSPVSSFFSTRRTLSEGRGQPTELSTRSL